VLSKSVQGHGQMWFNSCAHVYCVMGCAQRFSIMLYALPSSGFWKYRYSLQLHVQKSYTPSQVKQVSERVLTSLIGSSSCILCCIPLRMPNLISKAGYLMLWLTSPVVTQRYFYSAVRILRNVSKVRLNPHFNWHC
jgi:hypothetical protein